MAKIRTSVLVGRLQKLIVAVVVACASLLPTPMVSALQEPSYNEFLVPPSASEYYSYPSDIISGPDGALWFVQPGSNKIGRITTSGLLTQYAVPTPDGQPYDITSGPDGALWFVERYSGKIGRLTTSGVFTEYVVPTINSDPRGITSGPDGALWFTEYGGRKIGRITTGGVITEYAIPNDVNGNNPQALSITSGSDGALWFTQSSGGARSIGRITTSGNLTFYALSGSHNAYDITSGPDGALWFTMSGFSVSGKENPLGRMTTSGVFTEYEAPGIIQPTAITSGPDGKIYFASPGMVNSANTSGEVTSYPISAQLLPNQTPYFPGIATDSNGGVWITSYTGNRVGRLEINQSPSIAQLANATITEGSTFTQSGSFSDGSSTSWTATVDYGDGTGASPLSLSATNFALSHTYKDEGVYTTTVSITDNQGAVGTSTATVTVENTPVDIGSIDVTPTLSVVNGTVTASTTFTDPGVLDTHTAIWDWGDGTTSSGVVSENSGLGSVAGTHAYSTAGVYDVEVTVTDNGSLSSTRDYQHLSVAPTAPLNLNALTPTNTYPALSWTANGSFDLFNIYRNDTLVGTSTSPNYEDISAQEGSENYYVTSVKNGVESARSNMVSVTVDHTGPTVLAASDAAPNTNGWYNTDVTVSFTCNDAQTGIANCTAPITINSEGLNQVASGCGEDNAGNSTCTTKSVNIDKTAPVITASVSAAPNTNGWNSSPVTITFNCSDTLSGVASCTSPITISSEGLNQEVTGTAIDNAGNISTTTAIVSIDGTKPTIVATQTPAANGSGWNNTNVTVTYTCTDSLSGIASCSSPTTLSTEGNNLSATGVATDNAGNSNSVTISPIKLDKTVPTITGATMSNTFVLISSNETLSATVSDNLSGVTGGEFYVDTDPGQGNGTAMTYGNGKINGTTTISGLSIGQHKLYMRSKDAAGNWSTSTSVTFVYI